jgi:FkbM family methyltransferase
LSSLKRFLKRNSHSNFFKILAGFGRSLNRLYENRNHDVYSNGEFTVLKKIAKLNPKVIIDGGANIGKYSLLIQNTNPQATTYAFEPVKKTYEILKINIEQYSNIVAIQKGLYKEGTSMEINLFESNTHSSIFDINKGMTKSNKNTTIELVNGDSFLTDAKIDYVDFLKLDLEGAEYDAIVGFEESLKSGKIRAIQFEYGYINIVTKKLLIDFYNLFEKYGYIIGKIFPKTVEFRKYSYKCEDFLGPNFIAVKKNDFEIINLLK